jgi:hypothetical protein
MNGPANREEILNKLKKSSEVNITVTGRITRKKLSTPVWFVLDGDRVTLLPIKGSESSWLKNLAKDPHIELGVDDIAIPSKAKLVRDSQRVNKVFDKFRSKYRSMWSESYYTKRDVYVEVPV